MTDLFRPFLLTFFLILTFGQVQTSHAQTSNSNEMATVNNYSDLKNYNGTAKKITVTDPILGGLFYFSTMGIPDEGIVFSATAKGSGFWIRDVKNLKSVDIRWYQPSKMDISGVNNQIVIQKAVNNKYLNTIELTGGDTYFLAKSVKITDSKNIIGDGKTVLKLAPNLEKFARVIEIININNIVNMTVRVDGLVLDGNMSAQGKIDAFEREQQHALFATGGLKSVNLTVENCVFRNTAGDGYSQYKNVQCNLKKNFFYNCLRGAIVSGCGENYLNASDNKIYAGSLLTTFGKTKKVKRFAGYGIHLELDPGLEGLSNGRSSGTYIFSDTYCQGEISVAVASSSVTFNHVSMDTLQVAGLTLNLPNSTGIFTNCRFNCTAYGADNNAGYVLNPHNLTFDNCDFHLKNTSENNSFIQVNFVNLKKKGNLTFENCRMYADQISRGNTVFLGNGGSIFGDLQKITVKNCKFYGAYTLGAIYHDQGLRCDFVDNYMEKGDNCIYAVSSKSNARLAINFKNNRFDGVTSCMNVESKNALDTINFDQDINKDTHKTFLSSQSTRKPTVTGKRRFFTIKLPEASEQLTKVDKYVARSTGVESYFNGAAWLDNTPLKTTQIIEIPAFRCVKKTKFVDITVAGATVGQSVLITPVTDLLTVNKIEIESANVDAPNRVRVYFKARAKSRRFSENFNIVIQQK